ncbi:ubiquitin thioesterase trabid isoform X2 [Leptinotarsa decemlineata]|uniref:ubiquitin thioesterase trabid isoform X2 n=1 Tax=Leptinotarsa decemlineata TaxID=7539 RepID=UPI003D30A97C
MSDNEKKWSCEYCTYENYPSSIKCTMCRGPKPFVSEDIYRLHGDKINADEKFSSIGSAAGPLENNESKCVKCTYNLSNTCIICGATSLSGNTLHEHIQPLRISQHSDLAQSLSRSRNNSPPASLTNIENTRRTSQAKWMCQTCTYENWPKSPKCAMCGTLNSSQRSQASSLIIPSPDRIIDTDLNQDDKFKDYILDSGQGPNNLENERKTRHMRRNADWRWLNACMGVIEGDPNPVEAYLSSGGDPARTLTASEVAILNRSSAFDVGHTLVHLAIRFQREDLLSVLLSQIEGSGSGVKRVPSYVAPDLAADIRRHFASTIRLRKGNFPCNFVTEFPTFTLPAEVDELPPSVQDQLFSELLDKDAQEQLETDPAVINWSLDITVRLGSRLYALWNRSAGDCLLDSVMQATWGVFDRDNMLRRALAESLAQGGHVVVLGSQGSIRDGKSTSQATPPSFNTPWTRGNGKKIGQACCRSLASPAQVLNNYTFLHWRISSVARSSSTVSSSSKVSEEKPSDMPDSKESTCLCCGNKVSVYVPRSPWGTPEATSQP